MTRKAFAALLAAAAALRIFLIWRPPLWYDENFTLLVCRLPWDRFWNAILGDVHPPLYYLLIRPIALLIDAPWAIRIPSAIFSLAALWLAWRLFEHMRIPWAISNMTLLLMAILPLQLWFAQEARMYALFEALILAALLLGLLRKWIAYVVVMIAVLYTQNYGMFYMAIISLYLIIRDHRDWPKILQAALWSALAWLPWLEVMRSQMQSIAGAYWISVTFNGPGTVLSTLQQLFFMSVLPMPLLVPAFVVLFAVLSLGTIQIIRQRWGILLLAFGPIVLAVIASIAWQPVLLFRPLIGCTPFLYLVACWPLRIFPEVIIPYPGNYLVRRGLFAGIFVIPLLFAGVLSIYAYGPDLKGTKFPAAVEYVKAHWQPGDAIYYTDDGPMVNGLPYFGDRLQEQMPICDRVYGNLSARTRLALGVPMAHIADVPAQRIWIFAPFSALHPNCYLDQIAALTKGEPVMQIDDNQYISSGLWLAVR